MLRNIMLNRWSLFKILEKNCGSSRLKWVYAYICVFRSYFSHVKAGPPDAILGITVSFLKDKNPKKINLGIGAYRDDSSKPWVLPSIREAEKIVIEKKMNKEYAPISGLPVFCEKSAELALGKDSEILKSKRNFTAQCLSGTGSLRVGAAFISKFWNGCRLVYLPKQTWPNHGPIFNDSGLKTASYTYYDHKTKGLDFSGMLDSICKIPEKSIIVFHACAHNPTGVDPTESQWREISEIVKKKCIYPFFDMAYQGFSSGDLDKDAQAIRIFACDGHNFCLAQSYAKNMGLYGERCGALTIVCEDEDEAARIGSQIKIIIRPLYSSPPIHGARIATEALTNEQLYKMWLQDLQTMANRTKQARSDLKQNLINVGSNHCWDHITSQTGMFCYTGLNAKQVARLTKEFSIYLTKDGRIAVVGVTSKNYEYLAESIHAVTK